MNKLEDSSRGFEKKGNGLKHILIFFFCTASILCAIFLLCTVPFIKASRHCESQKEKIISEISNIPKLREISYINQTKDFDPIFDLYIEMEGNLKIIFRKVHYENGILVFETIPRFGNFGFCTCEYDISEKKFSLFTFNMFDENDNRFYNIGESPFRTKNVFDILANCNRIIDELSTFYVAKKDFLDYLKAGRDEDAFNVYDGEKRDKIIGYKEIRYVYKCSEEYEETFFGAQSQWKINQKKQ